MNAKPLVIFTAIAAASLGAMATAYVVEQRKVTAELATSATPVAEQPKAEAKIAVVEPTEAPKAVETPAVAEAPKKPEPPPEPPKVVVEPKVQEKPLPAEEAQVAVAEPAAKLTEEKPEEVAVAPKAADAPEVVAEPQVALVPEPSPKTPAVVEEKPAVQEKVAAPPPAENLLPAFDTVRVETTGDAVIAGRADPGSDVTIKWNGKFVGKTVANEDGSFVVVPDKPMKKGIGALTIEMASDGKVTQSDGSVIVAVKDNAPALVAKIDPIAPTTVLQVPAAVEAPATGDVQLNAVDYDLAGNIVFSGRAEPGNIVRFYVDNSLNGEVTATENGLWTFKGDARVSPGQHLLRADAVDAKGKVESRIELPFFRETAEAVAAAKIITPETVLKKAPDVPAVADTVIASVDKKRSITLEKSPADETQVVTAAEPTKIDTPVDQVTTTVETPVVADAPTVVETEPAAKLNPQKLVIQPGNNLWKLSREIYGKGRMFTVIYEANRDQLRNPNRIYPGQILTAPQQN